MYEYVKFYALFQNSSLRSDLVVEKILETNESPISKTVLKVALRAQNSQIKLVLVEKLQNSLLKFALTIIMETFTRESSQKKKRKKSAYTGFGNYKKE